MNCVRTTCAYCGVGCGVLAEPDGQGGAQISGDPDHPANFGRLCVKGSNLGETLSSEDRLVYPKIAGKQASWDDATDLVAKKFSAAIAEHGPDSVAFYVSGQLLTEDYYVANKLMKGFIGSANIDTNSRLCMASSVAGHKRAFGTDTVPGTYEDLEAADLIVTVGSNLAWCHPVLHQRILAAKDTRGTQIINIDPRRTATSELADLHLGITPGGDVALFNGLLSAISKAGAIDQEYVDRNVEGLEAAMTVAQEGTKETEALTGLTQEELTSFYRQWIGTKRVVTIYSQGVNQAADGSDKVNAILNCHLATGRIGTVGCGPFSVTGQPNAMGGREVGGLANMLAAHLDIENAEHRAAVGEFWDAKNLPVQAGLRAVDLFEACATGKIKALWIMCTNPAVSMPRADEVVKAIANVDFVTVSDIVDDTDTTCLADVILPATGWGEKDGTVTNSERRISRQRSFLQAPSSARHDWQIICEVAAKMGWENAFDYKSAHEIFSEWASMTQLAVDAGKDLDLTALSGLSQQEFDDLTPVQWPVGPNRCDSRFFANGQFYTPNSKARMVPVMCGSVQAYSDARYPFVFNTGRVRDHWHTMTRTAKSTSLSSHIAEPFVEIHPDDASNLRIAPSTLVQIDSPYGQVVARALVTARVQKGQVFSPIHWTSRWSAKARVGGLFPSICDPISGQPALKSGSVAVTPYPAVWYAFAVCVTEPNPTTDYWAKARIRRGWRMELAAKSPPAAPEEFARSVLGVQRASAVVYEDKATQISRIAFVQNDQLLGVMFSGSEPVALSRRFVLESFEESTSVDTILAGFGGSEREDTGPTVCSCFNVGANSLIDLIATGKATTLAEVSSVVQAGSNCGSCRPEIAAMLRDRGSKIAAE